jgi:hypothetical protein
LLQYTSPIKANLLKNKECVIINSNNINKKHQQKIKSLTTIMFKQFQKLLILIITINIVLWSVSSLITDSNIPKKTLIQGDFYNKVSSQLGQGEIKLSNLKNKGIELLANAVGIKDFVSAEVLQTTTENNIDNLTDFLDGRTTGFNFYIPQAQTQTALEQKINETTKKLNLATCSAPDLELIQKNGYKIEQNLCLPENVKEGSESIINYLDQKTKDSIGGFTTKNLENITKNQGITAVTGFGDSLVKGMLGIITNTIKFQKNNGLALSLILILFLAVLSFLVRGYQNLQKITFGLFWSLVIANFSILLIFGGVAYFGGFFKKLILPLVNLEFLESNGFTELLTVEVFNITIQYLVYSFIFAILILVAWVGLRVLGWVIPNSIQISNEVRHSSNTRGNINSIQNSKIKELQTAKVFENQEKNSLANEDYQDFKQSNLVEYDNKTNESGSVSKSQNAPFEYSQKTVIDLKPKNSQIKSILDEIKVDAQDEDYF